MIDVYITRDDVLVPISKEKCESMGIDEKYIESHNYNQLCNINCGTKVKTNNIITLERLLKIVSDDMYILINIKPSIFKNEIIINKISNVINNINHSNYFIFSEDFQMVNSLIFNKNNIKTGILVNNDYEFNYAYDFYVINRNVDNSFNIENINSNSTVFLYDDCNIKTLKGNCNFIFENI